MIGRALSFLFAFVASLSLLLVSGCSSDLASAPVSNLWYQKSAPNDYYRVRSGDTLYSIAWTFGLDYRSIAAENHLKSPYSLVAGQSLRMTNVPKGEFRAVRAASPVAVASKAASASRLAVKTKQKQKWLVSTKSPSSWGWPVKGRVVQKFKSGLAANAGLDISGRYSQPVRAAASGVVVYAGAGVRGYGNLIIVKHSASYLSAYAYNSRVKVKLGQRVKKGDAIAAMGRDAAGKAMLHFEIRKNGRPVNPLLYLRS